MSLLTSNEDVTPFNWEEFFYKNRKPILFLLIGLILLGLGIFWSKEKTTNNKIQVLESGESINQESMIVEISGAVEKPGVYKLDNGARVEDVIIAAGGISLNADRVWMEKYLNRAAKIVDGQKLYIPKINEVNTNSDQQLGEETAKNVEGYQTVSSDFSAQGSGLININTASVKELDTLWGIGPVYAQNIVEQRPYSNIEELLSRKVIKQNVFERIKEQITVY